MSDNIKDIENLISPGGRLKRNVHIPFIMVSMGEMSLTWNSQDDGPDYFISLSHTRMVDQANKMSLEITFCPKYGEDPNIIETAIINSFGICVVAYGDLATNQAIRVYKARILHYKVDINNGRISYNLSLVSAITEYNSSLFTYPPPPYIKEGKHVEYPVIIHTAEQLINAIEAAARVFEDRYKIEGQGDILFSQLKFGSEGVEFEAEKVSPINFIKAAIKLARPTSISSNPEIARKYINSYYTLIIDDHVGEVEFDHGVYPKIDASSKAQGKVKIVKVILQDSLNQKDFSAEDKQYIFEWGVPNSTVLDWSIEFDGSVVLSQTLDDSKYPMIYQIDPFTGKKSYASYTNQTVNLEWVNATPEVYCTNLVSSRYDFQVYASYAYQASLTVLGENQKTSIGESKVVVVPLVGGNPHHSAGLYTIIGMTDNIGSQGFTTTYKLIRNNNDEARQSYLNKLEDRQIYKHMHKDGGSSGGWTNIIK